ncbi:MAG: GTP cyclohydrolase II [Proteobacteria bacterium]|nr:GTP cyclohydrolase II [Pseudomonadota bacterium]
MRAVDLAVADLRRGGTVAILGADGRSILALAAEAATPETLARLAALAGASPEVVLSARRALVLGLGPEARGALIATPAGALSADTVVALTDPAHDARPAPGAFAVRPAAPAGCEDAAVALAKLARLLPAAVCAALPAVPASGLAAWAAGRRLLSVGAAEVLAYPWAAAASLRPVAEASVPLAGAPDTRIVAFRPADGGIEHLAIIVGRPSSDRPVLARLHSECFTGDILGSLRCDCGDQLRGAIEAMAREGSGVLVYLAQEGRGIGLVNKLRAYTLQDRGLDTLDANEQLGFEADERLYLQAAEILRQLGFRRVRLLTNNPDKVAALGQCGIEVVERVPHAFPANGHNERYLSTKARRFGHIF